MTKKTSNLICSELESAYIKSTLELHDSDMEQASMFQQRAMELLNQAKAKQESAKARVALMLENLGKPHGVEIPTTAQIEKSPSGVMKITWPEPVQEPEPNSDDQDPSPPTPPKKDQPQRPPEK